MILLTGTQRDRLLANGRQRDVDHIPVVKFFNPFGAGVWLATELDQGGDIMFGLADIGYPELCSWSMEELREVRLPFGMGIERVAMLKYGIPDLRTMYDSDLRWLRHYGFLPLDIPSPVRGPLP